MAASSGSSKFFVNRLAQLIASEDAAEALQRLRLAGLLASPPRMTEKKTNIPLEDPDSTQVGIWERRKNSDSFVRRMDKVNEWHLWASVGEIKPKGEAFRVVLIGESVARGYFYDPQFSGAKALSLLLESQAGKGAIEIVDLARTSLSFTEESGSVQKLALSALFLEPDAVIIFAGNNWRDMYSWADLPDIEGALREEGTPVLKRLAEKLLKDRIKRTMKAVATEYAAWSIPLLWIIPEFNLNDWRDPFINAPHLPGDGNREWLMHLEAAQAALRDGQFHTAASLATRMTEIDRGLNAEGFYILAECSRALGDLEAERRHLENARDSQIWDVTPDITPRRFGISRQTVLEEADQYQIETVDLARVFKEHLQGGLPGRRLFLDYCHMTIEGLHVAMAAASSWVLRTFGIMEAPWQQLMAVEIAPEKRIRAEAAFLAAVHNAHYYQPYELVHYFCVQALTLAPDLAAVMMDFIEMQNRHAPILLSGPGAKLATLNYPSVHHHILRNSQTQQVDTRLMDAMASAMDEMGVRCKESLARLRREERSITHKPADLLDSYYVASLLHPQERNWEVPGASSSSNNFFKAFSHKSQFLFIADARRPVGLHLTCRIPGPASSGSILLEVNGHAHGELDATREWANWDITIPAGTVQDGINTVTIQWPIPEFSGRDAMDAIIKDILLNITPQMFATFGEIHSFTASEAEMDAGLASVDEELRSSMEVQR